MTAPLEPPFICQTIQAYTGRDKNELSFKKDEVIHVTEHDHKSARYKGYRDAKPKKNGWFPSYYVRVVSMESKTVHGDSKDDSKDRKKTLAEVFAEGDPKEIQKWLKKPNLKALVDERGSAGKTALQVCVEKGQVEHVQTLLKAGASVNTSDGRGWTPLHHAALNTHIEIFELLLRANADPNALSGESKTSALHCLVRAPYTKDLERVMIALLQRGANIEAKNKYGETALHQAVSRLNQEAVSFLIRMHADVNSPNDFGETPLHKAARIGKPAKEVMKMLIAAKADPFVAGRNGTAADLIDFDANPELKEIFPPEMLEEVEEDLDTDSNGSMLSPPSTSVNSSTASSPAAPSPISALPQMPSSGYGNPALMIALLPPPPSQPQSVPPPLSPSSSPHRDSPIAASSSQGNIASSSSGRLVNPSFAPIPPVAAPPPLPVSSPTAASSNSNTPALSHVPPPPDSPKGPKPVAPMAPIQRNISSRSMNVPPPLVASTTTQTAMQVTPLSPRQNPSGAVAVIQVKSPPLFGPPPVAPQPSSELPLSATAVTTGSDSPTPRSRAPTGSIGPAPTINPLNSNSTPILSPRSAATPATSPGGSTPTTPGGIESRLRIGAGQRGALVMSPGSITADQRANLNLSVSQKLASMSSTASNPSVSNAVSSATPVAKQPPRQGGGGRIVSVRLKAPPQLNGNSPNAAGLSSSLANIPVPSSPLLGVSSSNNASNNSSNLSWARIDRAEQRKSRRMKQPMDENDPIAAIAILSEAQQAAEAQALLEERQFVVRQTQRYSIANLADLQKQINEQASFPAAFAPTASQPPPHAPMISSSSATTILNLQALPALISPAQGFRIELGTHNPLKDVSVNMHDFTAHYRLNFAGKKQLTFVGYLAPSSHHPQGTDNAFNPTIITVLEEPDRSGRFQANPVHHGLIRTKSSGQDLFMIMSSEISKEQCQFKGNFKERVQKFLQELCFPKAQLWLVKEKEFPPMEQELLELEHKDPERQPCFAFAVVYARAEDKTPVDMMNHEHGSHEFEEFLDLLGDRIELRGWGGFRGGLDVRTDTKGTHSVYTKFGKFELMFHVSTLLPYHPLDPLKLVRTRQVQNDVVMIIFREGDSPPYDPSCMPTAVTQSFLVVTPCIVKGETHYRLALAAKAGVPACKPDLPLPAVFRRDEATREFILTKLINAQVTARKTALSVMYTRPRAQQMKEIINKHIPEKEQRK